jgi:RNA polymerase sigma factor (sigma-70 family)
MEDNANTIEIATSRETAAEDEKLVQDCLNGDENAWNKLIDKYKRLIYSVPVKYGLSPDDAADIFQNVCVDLFQNLGKVRKIESLRSWLITVATHKCFHHKKQQKPNVELDAMEQDVAEDLAAAAPQVMAEVEEEQAVRDAIEKLSPRCAELVKMLFFQQPPLPYIEVAQKLGLATGSIGFIRGRCLNRLQKILAELGF